MRVAPAMSPRTVEAVRRPKVIRFSTEWALLALMLLTLGLSDRSQAQAPALLLLRPEDVTLVAGESAEVVIWIENVAGLYGAEVHLRFDPTILQVQDADAETTGVQISPGPLIDPGQGFVAANKVDNESGEIIYAITLLAPALTVDGSGELARFYIQGTAPGKSECQLEEVILATPEGLSIPVQSQAAWVTVTDSKPTEATSTASPATMPTSTVLPSTSTPTSTASPPTATPTVTSTTVPPATDTPPPTQQPTETVSVPASATPELQTPQPPQPVEPTSAAPDASPEPAASPHTVTASADPVEATATPPASAMITPIQWTPTSTLVAPSLTPTEGTRSVQDPVETITLSALPAAIGALFVVLLIIVARHLYRPR
jgi:hypothetical protein